MFGSIQNFTKKQRAIIEIERRRYRYETYTEKLPKTNNKDIKEFLKYFYSTILFNRSIILEELDKYPKLNKIYNELVPNIISYEDFWQRYYYRTSSIERVIKEMEDEVNNSNNHNNNNNKNSNKNNSTSQDTNNSTSGSGRSWVASSMTAAQNTMQQLIQTHTNINTTTSSSNDKNNDNEEEEEVILDDVSMNNKNDNNSKINNNTKTPVVEVLSSSSSSKTASATTTTTTTTSSSSLSKIVMTKEEEEKRKKELFKKEYLLSLSSKNNSNNNNDGNQQQLQQQQQQKEKTLITTRTNDGIINNENNNDNIKGEITTSLGSIKEQQQKQEEVDTTTTTTTNENNNDTTIRIENIVSNNNIVLDDNNNNNSKVDNYINEEKNVSNSIKQITTITTTTTNQKEEEENNNNNNNNEKSSSSNDNSNSINSNDNNSKQKDTTATTSTKDAATTNTTTTNNNKQHSSSYRALLEKTRLQKKKDKQGNDNNDNNNEPSLSSSAVEASSSSSIIAATSKTITTSYEENNNNNNNKELNNNINYDISKDDSKIMSSHNNDNDKNDNKVDEVIGGNFTSSTENENVAVVIATSAIDEVIRVEDDITKNNDNTNNALGKLSSSSSVEHEIVRSSFVDKTSKTTTSKTIISELPNSYSSSDNAPKAIVTMSQSDPMTSEQVVATNKLEETTDKDKVIVDQVQHEMMHHKKYDKDDKPTSTSEQDIITKPDQENVTGKNDTEIKDEGPGLIDEVQEEKKVHDNIDGKKEHLDVLKLKEKQSLSEKLEESKDIVHNPLHVKRDDQKSGNQVNLEAKLKQSLPHTEVKSQLYETNEKEHKQETRIVSEEKKEITKTPITREKDTNHEVKLNENEDMVKNVIKEQEHKEKQKSGLLNKKKSGGGRAYGALFGVSPVKAKEHSSSSSPTTNNQNSKQKLSDINSKPSKSYNTKSISNTQSIAANKLQSAAENKLQSKSFTDSPRKQHQQNLIDDSESSFDDLIFGALSGRNTPSRSKSNTKNTSSVVKDSKTDPALEVKSENNIVAKHERTDKLNVQEKKDAEKSIADDVKVPLQQQDSMAESESSYDDHVFGALFGQYKPSSSNTKMSSGVAKKTETKNTLSSKQGTVNMIEKERTSNVKVQQNKNEGKSARSEPVAIVNKDSVSIVEKNQTNAEKELLPSNVDTKDVPQQSKDSSIGRDLDVQSLDSKSKLLENQRNTKSTSPIALKVSSTIDLKATSDQAERKTKDEVADQANNKSESKDAANKSGKFSSKGFGSLLRSYKPSASTTSSVPVTPKHVESEELLKVSGLPEENNESKVNKTKSALSSKHIGTPKTSQKDEENLPIETNKQSPRREKSGTSSSSPSLPTKSYLARHSPVTRRSGASIKDTIKMFEQNPKKEEKLALPIRRRKDEDLLQSDCESSTIQVLKSGSAENSVASMIDKFDRKETTATSDVDHVEKSSNGRGFPWKELFVCVVVLLIAVVSAAIQQSSKWTIVMGDALCSPIRPGQVLNTNSDFQNTAPWWVPIESMKKDVFLSFCGRDRVRTNLVWTDFKKSHRLTVSDADYGERKDLLNKKRLDSVRIGLDSSIELMYVDKKSEVVLGSWTKQE